MQLLDFIFVSLNILEGEMRRPSARVTSPE